MVKILSTKTRNILFAIGIGIVVLAIAIPMIVRAVQDHALASSFATPTGDLVLETSTHNEAIVAYIESERPADTCAAQSVGHDDAWIYAIIWCINVNEVEQYTSAYELQGRLAYDKASGTISSGEFIGFGNTDPSAKDIYPYKVYQALQSQVDDGILNDLDATAKSRQTL